MARNVDHTQSRKWEEKRQREAATPRRWKPTMYEEGMCWRDAGKGDPSEAVVRLCLEEMEPVALVVLAVPGLLCVTGRFWLLWYLWEEGMPLSRFLRMRRTMGLEGEWEWLVERNEGPRQKKETWYVGGVAARVLPGTYGVWTHMEMDTWFSFPEVTGPRPDGSILLDSRGRMIGIRGRSFPEEEHTHPMTRLVKWIGERERELGMESQATAESAAGRETSRRLGI